MNRLLSYLLLALLATFSTTGSGLAFLTELRERGYSLIPAPQQVKLSEGDIVVDESWGIETGPEGRFSAGWIRNWSDKLHRQSFEGTGSGRIVLRVVPGTAKGAKTDRTAAQAYKLEITDHMVEITGNTVQGLFYGVQSFLQLLKRQQHVELTLPVGVITDWPDLELRFIHWDFLHHQKRPETIRRLLDWLALFKVNCVGLEIIDKYEFPRRPVAGCPGAYTKEEMQEFARYALERNIQIVPVVQAPGHFSYALKHPQFAHLRADGSNYQACMCDEDAIQLIFDLYQDLIDATPGVEYFHVATDEVYYAGICDKCEREYNPENRSRIWLEFVNRAHGWLAERGRKMIAWVEYPLLPRHVPLLPDGLINGVIWLEDGYVNISRKIIEGGNRVRQLSYTSMHGAELLFPNYFNTLYRGSDFEGRLYVAARKPRGAIEAGADPLGSFAASWDTSGPHEETFWLGWITVTQYAWSSYAPEIEQSVADFMEVFYGQGGENMAGVYRLLQKGARFFEAGWDRVISRERPLAYGNSQGPGIGTQRWDLTLGVPPLKAAEAGQEAELFSRKYAKILADARSRRDEIDQLIHMLSDRLARVERNRYNLEVFLSVAYLERHFPETILALESAEKSLLAAAEAGKEDNAETKVSHLLAAEKEVRRLLARRERMWQHVVQTWEKSRYPKNRDYNGREYLYIGSDVKDGFAGRRRGLDYLIAPFQRMDLEEWREKLVQKTQEYAARHGVQLDN